MMMDDKFFREIDHNCWSPDQRMKECDATTVDVQVLSTVPVMFSYWAKPEDTLDLARYLNDHIAQVVSENPKRFVGLGTLPMQAPELAVKELRRCMLDLNLAGVEVGSHIGEWTLDAPELRPFWAAAEELNAAVFVHPWDMDQKGRWSKYWMPWLVGMPAETCNAICSMVFGGVFERYPKLKVAFAHGGGSFPFTVGRIQHGYDCRPDLCAVDNKVEPRAYLGKFYVDSLVHDPDALEFLVKMMGKDRVMLGSDYPFPLGEQHPGKLIETCEALGKEVQAKLLSENALEFLGLDRERFL